MCSANNFTKLAAELLFGSFNNFSAAPATLLSAFYSLQYVTVHLSWGPIVLGVSVGVLATGITTLLLQPVLKRVKASDGAMGALRLFFANIVVRSLEQAWYATTH